MSMIIEDVRGQAIPAVEVFSLSIKALKDHLQKVVEVKNVRLCPETQWILTVPAIWTDTAKRFMRKAAEMVLFSSQHSILLLNRKRDLV